MFLDCQQPTRLELDGRRRRVDCRENFPDTPNFRALGLKGLGGTLELNLSQSTPSEKDSESKARLSQQFELVSDGQAVAGNPNRIRPVDPNTVQTVEQL